MNFQWMMPVLIAFFITSIIAPRLLPVLVRFKFGQNVRDDGPQSHLSKQGTPTMGGLILFLGGAITVLLFRYQEPMLVPMFITMTGFGGVGLLDDVLKIKKKQSEGLKSYEKFALQCLVAIGFIVYLYLSQNADTSIIIPFTYGYEVDLGLIYYPFILFVILGTVNGVNLTDGLDGLASTVTSFVAMFFIFATIILEASGSYLAGIVLGSLIAFLLYNVYPARVFMGDTGSLFLGGFVAVMATILKLPLFVPMFGLIYLAESLSVIIQVQYYKRTKKRVFKMAPIHHHFELKGMPETRVTAFFSTITLIMCMIALLALLGA